MKKLIQCICILVFLNSCSKKDLDSVISFNESIINIEKEEISNNNIKEVEIQSIKFLPEVKDGKILFVDTKNNKVNVYDLARKTIREILVKNINENNFDVTTNDSGYIYILNRFKKKIDIYDSSGLHVNSFRVKFGDKISLVDEKYLLVYKTFLIPNNSSWKEDNLSLLSLEGECIKSWSNLECNPNVDYFPIAGGSVDYKDNVLTISHWSDFFIKKYSKEGDLLQVYDKKPSFYYKMEHFKGLIDSEVKNWHNTTLQLNSFSFINDLIISQYVTSINSSKWLFIQNSKSKSIEVNIPDSLSYLGSKNDKLLFYQVKSSTRKSHENKIILYKCEIKKNILY